MAPTFIVPKLTLYLSRLLHRFRRRSLRAGGSLLSSRQRPLQLERNAIRLLLCHCLVGGVFDSIHHLLPSGSEPKSLDGAGDEGKGACGWGSRFYYLPCLIAIVNYAGQQKERWEKERALQRALGYNVILHVVKVIIEIASRFYAHRFNQFCARRVYC